jgi:hypothetical protein
VLAIAMPEACSTVAFVPLHMGMLSGDDVYNPLLWLLLLFAGQKHRHH